MRGGGVAASSSSSSSFSSSTASDSDSQKKEEASVQLQKPVEGSSVCSPHWSFCVLSPVKKVKKAFFCQACLANCEGSLKDAPVQGSSIKGVFLGSQAFDGVLVRP